MSDLKPERVWLEPAPSGKDIWSWGFWLSMARESSTEQEYVRADLFEALETQRDEYKDRS